MPPEVRGGFATDPKRLTALLNNLLTSKTLAAQARAEGVDRDPAIVRRFQLETDRFLAAAEVQRMELRAEAEFDAKQAQYLTRAREIYTLDREKYALPAQVSASHILFKVDNAAPPDVVAKVEKKAREVLKRAHAGDDFAALARTYSEDSSAPSGGDLGLFGIRIDPKWGGGGLDWWATTAYVESLRGYEKNRFSPMDPATRARVAEAAGACFDRWNYPR